MNDIANRIFYFGEYYDRSNPMIRRISHMLRLGQPEAIKQAAESLAAFFDRPNVALIPVPSCDGRADATLALAREIALRNPNVQVYDIITGNKRKSVYYMKRSRRDLTQLGSDFFGFRLMADPPRGKDCYVLDSVIGTGLTMMETIKIIPRAKAIAFALNTKSLFFGDELLRVMATYDIPHSRHTSLYQPLKTITMNERNIEYLKNQLKYLGFGDSLNQKLEENIKNPAIKNFSIMIWDSRPTKMDNTAKYELFFKQGTKSDNYFFPNFRTEIFDRDNKLLRANTFEVYKTKSLTARESVNLLEERGAKTVVNFKGQEAEGYVMLDFGNMTQSGNHKLKFINKDKVDVPKILRESHLLYDRGQENRNLVRSLEKGNMVESSFVADSVPRSGYVALNLVARDFDYYTRELEPMYVSQQGQGQGRPVQLAPYTGEQKESIAIWNKGGASGQVPVFSQEQLDSVPDRINGTEVDKAQFLLTGRLKVDQAEYTIKDNGRIAVNLPNTDKSYELTEMGVEYARNVDRQAGTNRSEREHATGIDPVANPLYSREESPFTSALLDDIENGVGFGKRPEYHPVKVNEMTAKQLEGLSKFLSGQTGQLPNISPKQLASVPDTIGELHFTREMKRDLFLGLKVEVNDRQFYQVDELRAITRTNLDLLTPSRTSPVLDRDVAFGGMPERQAKPWESDLELPEKQRLSR